MWLWGKSVSPFSLSFPICKWDCSVHHRALWWLKRQQISAYGRHWKNSHNNRLLYINEVRIIEYMIKDNKWLEFLPLAFLSLEGRVTSQVYTSEGRYQFGRPELTVCHFWARWVRHLPGFWSLGAFVPQEESLNGVSAELWVTHSAWVWPQLCLKGSDSLMKRSSWGGKAASYWPQESSSRFIFWYPLSQCLQTGKAQNR